MGGPRKRRQGRLDRMQGRLHQRPGPPAAFDPTAGERDLRIAVQGTFDPVKRLGRGAGIKVDGHIVARSRQLPGLLDNGIRVFVTQKNKGNLSHSGNHIALFRPLISLDSVNSR